MPRSIRGRLRMPAGGWLLSLLVIDVVALWAVATFGHLQHTRSRMLTP